MIIAVEQPQLVCVYERERHVYEARANVFNQRVAMSREALDVEVWGKRPACQTVSFRPDAEAVVSGVTALIQTAPFALAWRQQLNLPGQAIGTDRATSFGLNDLCDAQKRVDASEKA